MNFAAIWLVLCALPDAAPSPEGPAAPQTIERVVVLPFSVAGGIEPKTGALLDEQFLVELSQLTPAGVTILGASDAVAMLGQAQQAQLAGCDDASCLVEVGAALGARHIIVSSLGQVGDQFLVTAKLIDVDQAKVLARKSLTVDAQESRLPQAVREIARSIAASQGWYRADAKTGLPALLVAGAVTASVGLLAAIGFGAAAFYFDGQAGQAEAAWPQKQESIGWGAGMLGGVGLGLVAIAAGVGLAAFGLLTPGESP